MLIPQPEISIMLTANANRMSEISTIKKGIVFLKTFFTHNFASFVFEGASQFILGLPLAKALASYSLSL